MQSEITDRIFFLGLLTLHMYMHIDWCVRTFLSKKGTIYTGKQMILLNLLGKKASQE